MKSTGVGDRQIEQAISHDLRAVRETFTQSEESLSADVAPMAGELLARLEHDAEPSLAAMQPPDALSGAQVRTGLRGALSSIERALEHRPDDAPVLGPLQDVLRRQLGMLEEVAARVELGRQA